MMPKSSSTIQLKGVGSRAVGGRAADQELRVATLPTRELRLSLAQDGAEVVLQAQEKARLRLKEYPDRKVALKRLWIECAGKGGDVCKVGAASNGFRHGWSSSQNRRHAGGGYREPTHEVQLPSQLSRRQLIDMMTRELGPEDYEMLCLLDEDVKPKTLSEELVDRLPVVTGSKLAGEVCGVCLVEFEEDDEVKVIPTCGHLYHESCIAHWLTNCRNTCPLDGKELSDKTLST